MTVASATGPAAPNNTLVVVPTLAKHDIFIDGGVAHMSDYLATLERKIDSRWMNGKTANKLKPHGPTFILETWASSMHSNARVLRPSTLSLLLLRVAIGRSARRAFTPTLRTNLFRTASLA